MHHPKQQGAALIMAIFIVAITAIIATAMVLTLRGFISQSELIKTSDQLTLDLQGVQDWTKAMIKQYELDPKKVIQSNVAPDAPMFKLNMQFNTAIIDARVYDAQSLFNLNNLIYTQYQPNLMRLLQTVSPTMNESKAHQIAMVLSQRLANKKLGLFVNAQEIRALPVVSAKLMQRLLPYVIALPLPKDQVLPVDINAATIPVLASLSSSVSLAKAVALIACRKDHGWFFDAAQYEAACMQPLGLSGFNISNHTNYFLLRAVAEQDGMRLQLTSLFELKVVNKQPRVSVLWVTI